MRITPFVMALGAVCILTHPALAADPPALFHADAAGTGRHGDRSASHAVAVRFSLRTGGPIRSSPAVHGGRLYVGSTDGTLYAADARTGEPLWRWRTGGAITSTPAVDDEGVLVSSRDGYLYCLRARDGRLAWKFRFGAERGTQNYWDYFMSSPVLHGSSVLIGGGDGFVYALDRGTGRARWKFDAQARVRSTVAVRDGRVVFGTTSGHVYALRETDGAPIWRFATQGAAHTFADAGNDTTSVMASPTFAGDVVAVGARDGYLYALDAATGRERWRTTHDGSSWILSTAYDGRWLYVGSGSAQFVQAADPQTGVERWRFPTRGAVFSSLTLAGGTLLFTDFTGVVYAVETRGGALQWQFPLHGRSLSTPVYAAGLVYCSGDDGALIALAVDDDTVAAAPAADARRIAFWQGPSTAGAFAWFQNGVDAAFLAYLLGAGYERMDRAALVAFMHDAGAQRRRSLVVFVDNRIPDELAEAAAGTAPLRRYLEAGGKVVLLGPNPLAYVTDAGGQVTGIDYSIPQRILDVRYAEPERVAGYYASFPTDAGRAIGLRSPMVGTGAIEPAQGVTVLARDEFGQASAWLKSYGGPRGTGLLQLALPRQEAGDFSELRAAIEDGVAR